MVDYVAVLRRTIDALPKNTPEIRGRVYAKARTTVESKLAMINPPPSQALIAKQMSGLEAAIGTVEADFAVAVEALPEPIVQESDPFADIFNGMADVKAPASRDAARDALSNADVFSIPEKTREAIISELPPQPAVPVKKADAFGFELPELPAAPVQMDNMIFPDLPDRPRLPETSNLDFPDIPENAHPAPRTQDSFDDVFGDLPPPVLPRSPSQTSLQPSLDEPVMTPDFKRPPRPKAKPGRILMPLLGLALLSGAGALAWTERNQIIALLQPEPQPAIIAQPETPVAPATSEPAPETATEPEVAPATPNAPAEPAANAPQKFTQRLNSDGTEIDAGAATSGGEQSVAQLEPATEAPAAEAPAAEPATPVEPPAAETPAVEPALPAAEPSAQPNEAMPVGQKAIFYEERTSGAEGSARTGAVVWSVVRESPGNDRPPEPAIRGELTIPELSLNVRMTLRRNADATLPASHILELIMSVPDDFAGGTIEDVQRVNFKPTEESAGAALAATPVKVADKFFLVALENTPAAQSANLKLLREQNWIDLPVVYRTGRRALFTMEKGLVGDQVFKQVLDAWIAAPLQ